MQLHHYHHHHLNKSVNDIMISTSIHRINMCIDKWLFEKKIRDSRFAFNVLEFENYKVRARVCTMCGGVGISRSKHDNWHLFGRYALMLSTLTLVIMINRLGVWARASRLAGCILINNAINTRKSVRWIPFSTTPSTSKKRVYKWLQR